MTAPSSDRARRVAARLAVSLAVASAALATPALAQDPAPPPGGPGGRGMGGQPRMMAMMFEGISLSDVQKARLDSIAGAFQQRAQAMPRPEPGTPPTDEQRQARMKLMEERMAAFRGVLTADQAKTFDANMAAMRERMGGMGGMRPPGRR